MDRIDELNEQLRVGKRELKLLKRKIRHYIYYESDYYNRSSESEEDIKFNNLKVKWNIKLI